MDASLTHGISNGFRHFPDDIEVLEELGMKNLDDIELAPTKKAWGSIRPSAKRGSRLLLYTTFIKETDLGEESTPVTSRA